jgi:hypothetical protein
MAILINFPPPVHLIEPFAPGEGSPALTASIILLGTMLEAFRTAVGSSFSSWDVALDLNGRREPKIRRGQSVDSELGVQIRTPGSTKESLEP